MLMVMSAYGYSAKPSALILDCVVKKRSLPMFVLIVSM